MDDKDEIQRLQSLGFSNSEIAKIMHYSHISVIRISGTNDYFRRPKCAYTGILQWMTANRCGKAEFARRLEDIGCIYSRPVIHDLLAGKSNPKKDLIDAVLKLTGFTYEEAFNRGEK